VSSFLELIKKKTFHWFYCLHRLLFFFSFLVLLPTKAVTSAGPNENTVKNLASLGHCGEHSLPFVTTDMDIWRAGVVSTVSQITTTIEPAHFVNVAAVAGKVFPL